MKRSLLGGAALLLAQQAFADPGLSMQLQLLAQGQQADHYLTQYEVTLTNSGTEPLASISIVPDDLDLSASATELNELQVATLAAGAQTVVYWDLKTLRATEGYTTGALLYFNATATNALGEQINLELSADELPLQ